jgi:hypothetical protein
MVVRGAATGIEYRFSGLERRQFVDPRDAVAIVRNPLFQVEAVVELRSLPKAGGGGADHT